MAEDSPPLGLGQGGRSWSWIGGPHLLTEDDWAGACADTLLPGVLPCLLATRLAWKGQFLSLESQISLSPAQVLTFQGSTTGGEESNLHSASSV